MVPIIVLTSSFAVLWGIGGHVYTPLSDWHVALSAALAIMFFVTASAHWGKRRADLMKMVPPNLPSAEGLVTVTGILEIAGACGLLIPLARTWAALGLAVLLILMLPANIYAARHGILLDGRPAMRSAYRIPLQLLFIACLIAVAWMKKA